MPRPQMIYLTPHEALAVQLGLARLLADTSSMVKSQNVPWNPEARGTLKDICEAAGSAARKIEKHTGIAATLPDYKEGDEDEFLTKES